MSVNLSDLSLIGENMLAAIIRDEQLGEKEARRINNRKLKSRLRGYIIDRKIPDPSSVSPRGHVGAERDPHRQASRLQLPSGASS